MKNIVFLNRAYNDMDIQMSLVRAFAQAPHTNVRVVGYPCDGDVGAPHTHEAAPYMSENFGVIFETVMQQPQTPMHLGLLYKCEQFLKGLKESEVTQNSKLLSLPFKVLHVSALKLLRNLLQKDTPWLTDIAHSWNADAIIIDEALSIPGRSYMVDHALPELTEAGTKLFMIHTGQAIYKSVSPTGQDLPNYKKTPAEAFFVSGPEDINTCKVCFPEENITVVGNPRMDKAWIETIHKNILVPPYFDKEKYTSLLPKTDGPKVVFMLSKMNYGIRAEELKETLRMTAGMDGVNVVIKPHTRGMKFDFMSQKEVDGCVIADDIPSAILIEWADILLFTGSGIVFHAMVQDKAVGFLAYCQENETIFDAGEATTNFESVKQLQEYLESYKESPVPADTNAAWMADNLHNGNKNGEVSNGIKDFVLSKLA